MQLHDTPRNRDLSVEEDAGAAALGGDFAAGRERYLRDAGRREARDKPFDGL